MPNARGVRLARVREEERVWGLGEFRRWCLVSNVAWVKVVEEVRMWIMAFASEGEEVDVENEEEGSVRVRAMLMLKLMMEMVLRRTRLNIARISRWR